MKQALRKTAERLVSAVGKTALGGRLVRLTGGSLMHHTRDVEHDGLRLTFAAPNEVNVWRIATFSSKEPETLQWIDGFAEGSVLWDVGANVGLYSSYAAKRRGCRVYAFEPSVFNLELLARNVWLNGLSDRVTLVPLPLTDALANSTLNMSSTEWGGAMSTFDKSYTHDGSVLRKTFEFRTIGVSMDESVARLGIPQPDYIKMDVDGIEHLILRGGAGVLSKVHGVLIEVNEAFEKQATECAQYLGQAGLTLKEKRHAGMFESTAYASSYNQIWHRTTSR